MELNDGAVRLPSETKARRKAGLLRRNISAVFDGQLLPAKGKTIADSPLL
ncbi:MAG: hypothetical protein SOZ27_06575 [Spirochaetia bacterium]|nr:hypothetical protein [Spirochaetia bacterium]